MTELQWLIQMLTKQKLSSGLKDLFIERIGEVEAQLTKPTAITRPVVSSLAQAPSTQRILEEMANETPLMPVKRAIPPPAVIDKETGRAMVSTGKGTSGPRKF